MNGVELAYRFEERYLRYPVILITSGLARDVPGIAAHPNIRDVLEKPLEDDALLVRIHAALAAPAVPRHGAGVMLDPGRSPAGKASGGTGRPALPMLPSARCFAG